MKINLLKYGLTAMMMAFAMTLCYSCSNDDDDPTVEEPTPPTNGESKINGHAYVKLAGLKWATENVGEVNGVEAIAGPGAKNNEWGCYLYSQDNAKKAAASWGGTWKLPTEIQWKVLIKNCIWTWQDNYLFNDKTMKGYKVSDKNDASKFIFLPAAGIYFDGGSTVHGQGDRGYYWSADDGRRYLVFNGGDCNMGSNIPDCGLAVRPVSQ